jgi:hypothetical protein
MTQDIKPITFTLEQFQFLKNLLAQITVNPMAQEALGVVTMVQSIAFAFQEASAQEEAPES